MLSDKKDASKHDDPGKGLMHNRKEVRYALPGDAYMHIIKKEITSTQKYLEIIRNN